MKKEKFDSILSSRILNQEENYVPSFNRDKVWRKSTGQRSRRNLVAIISVAATLIIALNIIGVDQPAPLNRTKIVNPTTIARIQSHSPKTKEKQPRSFYNNRRNNTYVSEKPRGEVEFSSQEKIKNVAIQAVGHQIVQENRIYSGDKLDLPSNKEIINLPSEPEEAGVTISIKPGRSENTNSEVRNSMSAEAAGRQNLYRISFKPKNED